jgi:hypothetical protein
MYVRRVSMGMQICLWTGIHWVLWINVAEFFVTKLGMESVMKRLGKGSISGYLGIMDMHP